ncbi:MAG: hypothetical protein WD768_14730 [Phycisphaeraceae bacterium]
MSVPGSSVNPHPVSRAYNHLVGWACLLIGMAIVAALAIVPAWLDLQQAEWERGFIELCRSRQQETVEGYEQFALALQSNDPVLLERLAFEQLRQKPAHGSLVKLPDELASAWKVRQAWLAGGTPEELADAPLQPMPAASLEQWLHHPQPVVGLDYAPYVEMDSMLIRLSTGPRRLVLLVLAGFFILCGLFFPGPWVKGDAAREVAMEEDEDAIIVGEIDGEDEEMMHVAA